ncbi:MAG: T9SS type A sorting domain-containing protein, partial [Ignavibacteria bacterium]|nr:T9SS type A sorting domain-containing protein [Ignavibacteria bacterium]
GMIIKTTNGGGNLVEVKQIASEIPKDFILKQNFPNPFNSSTKITFMLPRSSFVRLVIFDLLGREIETLIDERLSAGVYEKTWNADNYPSGVYFYRLVTENSIDTKKMVLIK